MYFQEKLCKKSIKIKERAANSAALAFLFTLFLHNFANFFAKLLQIISPSRLNRVLDIFKIIYKFKKATYMYNKM